ncbi:DUF5916 domain-containing protein [Acidobacteriota bacterium]
MNLTKALRVEVSPEIDGYLEMGIWENAPVATHFIQKQPAEGKPATEDTEVRFLYDEEKLYIGVMCFDSEPAKIIAHEKKRDSRGIYDNDHIQIMLDTFHDRRNGYVFVVNPLGAKLDLQVRKEGKAEGGGHIANPNINTNWDGVWKVETLVHEEGWSAEIEMPLVTLRFNEESREGWGLNILRNVRRKNEESTWAPLPRNLNIYKISLAGELRGLEGLKKGLNLQVKPFVMMDRISQRGNAGDLTSKNSLDAGIDFKYGLTSNLTLDVTVNTDFSQVEADDEQINLTRFSLYFPEKREFFLENSALFSIGSPDDAMIFFSRRIGIADGEEIPLLGGVKIAGKAGRFNLGVLNMQAQKKGEIPSNNFTVVRVSRDILGQSAVGFMATNRQSSIDGDYNRALAVDGDFIFGKNFSVSGYYAMTSSPGLQRQNKAGKLGFVWRSDLWDAYAYYFDVQENFNAEMGFVKRTGIRRFQMHFGYTPEPDIPGIRKLDPHIYFAYTTDQDGRLLLRERHAHLAVNLINGGSFGVQWNENHEFVDIPFPIQDDIIVPVGRYTSSSLMLDFNSDRSRRFYYAGSYRGGSFYGGNYKIINISAGFRPVLSFSGEVSLLYNEVDLLQGSFANHILRARGIYNFSTRLALMSLIQWNSETNEVNVNMRFSFIHKPGSWIYVVYNERRLVEGFETGILDRTIALKFTYLFNF